MIPEEGVTQDKLRVIKPLKGIENNKFHPIVKELDGVRLEYKMMESMPSAMKTVKKMIGEIEP